MSITDESYYDYALWQQWEEIKKRRKREPEWVKHLLQEEPQDEAQDTTDLVKEYLVAGLEESRRAVEQLEREIYVREQLHDQSIRQVDYQITIAANSLSRFTGWGVGYNRGVDQKRIDLEHQLDTLRREKRTSRLRFWEDIVRLRGQLHEFRHQYRAAARRARVRVGD